MSGALSPRPRPGFWWRRCPAGQRPGAGRPTHRAGVPSRDTKKRRPGARSRRRPVRLRSELGFSPWFSLSRASGRFGREALLPDQEIAAAGARDGAPDEQEVVRFIGLDDLEVPYGNPVVTHVAAPPRS